MPGTKDLKGAQADQTFRNYFANICGHTIWSKGLSPGAVVIDAGGNIGNFAAVLFRRFGVMPFSLEPQPTLRNVIEQRNCCRQVLPYALTGQDGTTIFRMNSNPEAGSVYCSPRLADSVIGEITVRSISLETLLQELEIRTVDLPKMDIEGSEIDVLESIPAELLRTVGQITVEYHDFIFPEHLARILNIDRRLNSVGFERILFSQSGLLDVLYVNRCVHEMPKIALAGLRLRLNFHRTLASLSSKRIVSLCTRRTFPASPQLLFHMWTSPPELAKWWCPSGHTILNVKTDVRKSGTYRIAMKNLRNGGQLYSFGTYSEIVPHVRLVYTLAALRYWPPSFPRPFETRVTVEFHDNTDFTEVVVVERLPASKQGRDARLTAWSERLDRLNQALVARSSARVVV